MSTDFSCGIIILVYSDSPVLWGCLEFPIISSSWCA